MDEFDPLQKVDLAMVRAEHQKRYQVMINFIKEQVGDGIEYTNAVVHVVISPNGAYFELNDLPEEFCGAAGSAQEHHFVAEKEAVELLARAVHATDRITSDNTRSFEIMVLYTKRGLVDRKNCYVYHLDGKDDAPPLVIGHFQAGVMPLFFKVKVESEFAADITGNPGNIVFCMANAGDRHLLVRLRQNGNQVTDLSDVGLAPTVQ